MTTRRLMGKLEKWCGLLSCRELCTNIPMIRAFEELEAALREQKGDQ